MMNNSKFKRKIISNITFAIMLLLYSLHYSKRICTISSTLQLSDQLNTKHKNEIKDRCIDFFLNKYDEFLFIYRTLNHMSINNVFEYTSNNLNILHMLHSWLN